MSAKFINLFSRQDFFDKVFRKSGSYNSLNGAKSAISNLDIFCDVFYHKKTDDLLTEFRMLDKKQLLEVIMIHTVISLAFVILTPMYEYLVTPKEEKPITHRQFSEVLV